jgi:ABC-type multidrug transport system ATPase subunit
LLIRKLKGLKHIDKVIEIDQSPIGRTPRSNPATYTNVFADIRNLYAALPEAKIRGYKAGRFSFNVKGGRCETCQGGGVKTIEMNFLPDVYVECETCSGKRYNRETLEVRYKGKSISDVLNMTIEDAVDFFENIPSILQKIKTLKEVGLGYLTLGQQSTTLSGGEAQRIKLAAELSKKDTGKTFYILDEPSTGLHFEDIRILLDVLYRFITNGSTVLIIEHNLDIIKVADHIIDLGMEGGEKGGELIVEGTPEEIIKNKNSFTAHYLKIEMEEHERINADKQKSKKLVLTINLNYTMSNNEEKIRKAFENRDWNEIKVQDSWQIFKIMAEFVEAFEKLGKIGPCVSIFGSARTKPNSPYYELAEEIAKKSYRTWLWCYHRWWSRNYGSSQ